MVPRKASKTAVCLTDLTVQMKAAYLAAVRVVRMAPRTASKTTFYLADWLLPMMAAYVAILMVVAKDDSVLGWLDGTNNGCLLGYIGGCEDGTTEGIEDGSLIGWLVGTNGGSLLGYRQKRH